MCVEAIGRLSQLWEGSTNEDRNRLAHMIFDYIVFDLDERRIVDFKLKPRMDEFLVLRATTADELEECGKCDPGKSYSEHFPPEETAVFLQQLMFPQRKQVMRFSNRL